MSEPCVSTEESKGRILTVDYAAGLDLFKERGYAAISTLTNRRTGKIQIDLDKVSLIPICQGEKSSLEQCFARLRTREGVTWLDAYALQALYLNQHLMPKEWKDWRKFGHVYFLDTIFISQHDSDRGVRPFGPEEARFGSYLAWNEGVSERLQHYKRLEWFPSWLDEVPPAYARAAALVL